MNWKVGRYLRKKSEEQDGLFVPEYITYRTDIHAVEKIAINESEGKIFMDNMWDKYGGFNDFVTIDEIMEDIKQEFKDLAVDVNFLLFRTPMKILSSDGEKTSSESLIRQWAAVRKMLLPI